MRNENIDRLLYLEELLHFELSYVVHRTEVFVAIRMGFEVSSLVMIRFVDSAYSSNP